MTCPECPHCRASSEEALCESPVELAFLREIRKRCDMNRLVPNVPVLSGKYRIDFAIADRKVGVEIDGHAYHSDKDTFVRDRARQRELETDGWRLIRFAAAEINDDVSGCVHQLLGWLAGIGVNYRNGAQPPETSVLERLAAAFPPIDPVTGRTKLGGRGRARRDPARPNGPFPWHPANELP